MKYKTKKLENKNLEIEITLSKEEWDKAVEDSFNKNKGKYTVEGFRKGKAPRKVIEKVYGAGVFYDDAINNSFFDAYEEILNKDTSIEPVDNPSLDIKSLDDKGIVMVAQVVCKPEVKLNRYKGLNIKVETKKVTEKDVENELKRIQEQNSRLVEVENGEVKDGSIVNLDFSGSIDGVKFDGGTAEGYDLTIGSHSFIDNFEDQLIGLKAGDEKNVEVTFPENYQEKSLAGKKAVFACKINAVKEKQLPEINDEFVANVSEFETLADYKKDIKKNLEKQNADKAKIDAENKVIEEIINNMEVDLPEVMIERELDEQFKDMEYNLMYQGLNLETYAKYLNTTVEELRKARKAEAEKGCKAKLAMQEIVKLEKLVATEKEINDKIEELSKRMNKTAEDFKKTMSAERLNYIKNDILVNKLLEFLVENNKADEKAEKPATEAKKTTAKKTTKKAETK